jgi:hypothetical protein
MEASDQRDRVRRLELLAELAQAPRKATKADLGSIGIQVIEQE